MYERKKDRFPENDAPDWVDETDARNSSRWPSKRFLRSFFLFTSMVTNSSFISPITRTEIFAAVSLNSRNSATRQDHRSSLDRFPAVQFITKVCGWSFLLCRLTDHVPLLFFLCSYLPPMDPPKEWKKLNSAQLRDKLVIKTELHDFFNNIAFRKGVLVFSALGELFGAVGELLRNSDTVCAHQVGRSRDSPTTRWMICSILLLR